VSDHEDPEWSGTTEPDEATPTEGVRIIGAQEAAEAAARPDVARRRRRGEKGFGDRPDQPEVASDLPKITISTTEPDPTDPGPTSGDELPRTDDDGIVARPEPGTEWSMGHARVVSEPSAEESALEAARVEPADEREPAAPPPFSGSFDVEADHSAPRPDPRPWVDPEPQSSPDVTSDDEPFGDDDSFTLPHWTEPPTGQVPRVVMETDDEVESFGSQPRWRDEGERTSDAMFEDLLEDPKLAGLADQGRVGGGEGDEIDFFDSEVDRDPLEAFAPEASGAVAEEGARRRSPRRRPGRPSEEAGGDEYGGGSGSGADSGGIGGDRNLVMAVGVGVILVGIGLLAFSMGGLATAVLAALIVGAAAFEYFKAVTEAGYAPAGLIGLVAVVGLVFAVYFADFGAYPIVLAITIMAGLLWYLWVAPVDGAVQSLGVTFLGFLWIGFLGSFATLFLGLGRVIEDRFDSITSNPGIGVLIAAVIVAVSHDIGAYFGGRYFGKTPMSAVSPNKTLEGLASGVVAGLIVTVIVVGFVGIAPIGPDKPRTFVFALLCSLMAPLGDLCESFIKRDLGVKDMGSILPGHGGILDRFDALLFVLPTAYFVTVLFDLWSGIGT